MKTFYKCLGAALFYAVLIGFLLPWLISAKGVAPVILGFALAVIALIVIPAHLIYHFNSKK